MLNKLLSNFVCILGDNLCLLKWLLKIKDRPNYYYFDRALKNNKLITVKYSLFTDDIYEAKALAIKVKSTIDKISNSKKSNISKSYSSFESYIKALKNSQQTNKSYIDYKEHKEIFKKVIISFYSPIFFK